MLQGAQAVTAPALRLSDVTAGYGGRPVLRSVSLEVQAGEAVGITGPNGAGKSTLLRVVMGLLVPQEGSVHVFGLPLASGRSRRRLRTRIGYVAQEQPAGEMPITVFDAVLLGRWGRTFAGLRRPSDNDRKAVWDRLAWVGLADRARHDVRHLSGGQRQRVALARALVGNPDILILDEPTTHLDAAAQTDFSNLLIRLRCELRITTLLVSHDAAILQECTDRILTMREGRFQHEAKQRPREGSFDV